MVRGHVMVVLIHHTRAARSSSKGHKQASAPPHDFEGLQRHAAACGGTAGGGVLPVVENILSHVKTITATGFTHGIPTTSKHNNK